MLSLNARLSKYLSIWKKMMGWLFLLLQVVLWDLFAFLLWEQQSFVPINSYPMKLLLDLNFCLQIKQKWKKLKACIPELVTSGEGGIVPFEIGKKKSIALGGVIMTANYLCRSTFLENPTKLLENIFCRFMHL